jgi:hypothetical protein
MSSERTTMALLGTAALAMWWDVAADVREEFEHWHSHEHFAERLSLPGFRRGTRWRSAARDGGFFVMYELADYAVLSSPAYVQRLNAPTPWSTKMMPHHRGMVRSQCRVLASHGSGTAGQLATVRLSPIDGSEDRLRAALEAMVVRLVAAPGLVGAHLLHHERPPIAPTAEQRIRGGDAEADWILVVTGYDESAIDRAACEVRDHVLQPIGTCEAATVGRYTLAHSATSADAP